MENSMMINIKVNFNRKTFPTIANPNTPLNTFLMTVLQSFGLSSSQYALKHQNTPILLTDSQPISVLLKGKASSLVFNLIQNDLKSPISPKPMAAQAPTPTVIKIENVSDVELTTNLINNFITMKQLNPNSISREINFSVICLTVPTKQLALELIQYLSQMKLSNTQLKNLKVSIDQSTQKSQSHPFRSIISSNQMKANGNGNGNQPLAGSRSVTLPSIRNDRYDNSKFITINPEEDNSNRKMIMKYYSKQEYIRNASPYIDEEEKRLQEYHRNKKKWLVNDGFLTSVGKYNLKSNHFIPNYVNLTPSNSPLNHRFRDINKNHWIQKKGFFVC